MKIILAFLASAILCGCHHKQVTETIGATAVSATNEIPSATGRWLSTYHVNLYLDDSNGLINGVITWPLETNVPPHRIQGIRSGNLIELFYCVVNAGIIEGDNTGWTNEHTFELHGLIEGENIQGTLVGFGGVRHQLTNWNASRISIERPVMPAINEAPIVHIVPRDTNNDALMAELKKSIEEEKKSVSNFNRILHR